MVFEKSINKRYCFNLPLIFFSLFINLIFLKYDLQQNKKRITRQKAEARKAELIAQGVDVYAQASNMLDEGEDTDILF